MLLIRSAIVVLSGSTFNGKTVDIFIENGKVKRIGAKLKNTENAPEVSYPNLHIAPGFVDMHAYIGEPGFEQKETIASACKAAAKGGITQFCVMPNLNPASTTKSQIEFLKHKAKGQVATLLPVGALTHNLEGKDLAEVYDMHQAGAAAFSDGYKALPNAGVLERALLYTSAFDGLVMVHAEEKSMSKNGVMHEGIVSTKLGLPGTPAVAEEIAIARDLSVVEYTNGRLHFLDVSLKKSVELIKQAKKKKLNVTASCNAYNLLLTHEAVVDYNSATKVNPPLREQKDIDGLIKGIEEGVIDTITSQHSPQDEECKKLEFDKADFGMIGFETLFPICNTVLNKTVGLEKIVDLLAVNPRKLLKRSIPSFEVGSGADFVLFNPEEKWTFTEKDIASKSKNTPFIGKTFVGKIYQTVNQ
jgi:dihydroorotase